MADESNDLAEPKNKVASLAVTQTEKRDIAFLAGFREISESDLLRSLLDMGAISAEAARIRALGQTVVA